MDEVRNALGIGEGYVLDWRIGKWGCQVLNPYEAHKLLPCPETEGGGKQCEVIGPHTQHQISDHTILHQRAGNGWSCSHLANMTLASWCEAEARLHSDWR